MNLPNKLTMFRMFLVAVLIGVWLFPYNQFNIVFPIYEIKHVTISSLNLIVLGIFVVASITDFLDGAIARKKKLVTTFGKFADPIADKLLVNSTLIILVSKNIIPVIPVVIMIGRDIIVDCCRMIAAENNIVISAGALGKTKTVLQMIAIILVLLNNLPFELYGLPISELFLWASSFVSIASGFVYFNSIRQYIFKSM